jgi:hypothetical protein
MPEAIRPLPPRKSVSGFDQWTPAHTQGLSGLGSGLLQDYKRAADPVAEVSEHPVSQLAAMLFLMRPTQPGAPARAAETFRRLGRRIPVDTGPYGIETKETENLMRMAKEAARLDPAKMSQVARIDVARNPDFVDVGMVPTQTIDANKPVAVINKNVLGNLPKLLEVLLHEPGHAEQSYIRNRGGKTGLNALYASPEEFELKWNYRPWEVGPIRHAMRKLWRPLYEMPMDSNLIENPDLLHDARMRAFYALNPTAQRHIVKNPSFYRFGQAVVDTLKQDNNWWYRRLLNTTGATDEMWMEY